MPVHDWQFWLVTLIAIAAMAGLVRSLVPKRKKRAKTTLTISADPRHHRDPRRPVVASIQSREVQ